MSRAASDSADRCLPLVELTDVAVVVDEEDGREGGSSTDEDVNVVESCDRDESEDSDGSGGVPVA